MSNSRRWGPGLNAHWLMPPCRLVLAKLRLTSMSGKHVYLISILQFYWLIVSVPFSPTYGLIWMKLGQWLVSSKTELKLEYGRTHEYLICILQSNWLTVSFNVFPDYGPMWMKLSDFILATQAKFDDWWNSHMHTTIWLVDNFYWISSQHMVWTKWILNSLVAWC